MAKLEELGLEPFGPGPNGRQMEWYRRGKTAFLHFTVNTFTDMEWGDGTESPGVFAPTELDCRQWARVLKAGGFTAAILTAKHHDGFCLWDTALTDHQVMNSPLKRDVVKEFCEACREYGIKPGLYLSPWDRHEPRWGTDDYNDFYVGQLKELMGNYGPIWECWWDGAGSTRAHYDWKRWVDTVHALQPQCVIWGGLGASPYVDARWVGNEGGVAGGDCWATIGLDAMLREDQAWLNTGDPEGERFIPAETNVSIRPGWFWHESQNGQVMDGERLMKYWFESAGRNTAILLNLPPDRRGLIHEKDAEAVAQWQRRLEEIFSKDMAADGTVTPGWEPLLDPDFDEVAAATELCPQIRVDFPEERIFDCFQTQEVIELGHRIRGFRVEALTEEGWSLLKEGKCVGFCRAERFAPVRARAVRLTVTEAAALPVLRSFGVYSGAAPLEKCETFPKEPPVAQALQTEKEIQISLEGIYPYDTVELSPAPESWQVHAFNGTDYVLTAEATGTEARFPAVTGSYRLKLTAERFAPDAKVKILWSGGRG